MRPYLKQLLENEHETYYLDDLQHLQVISGFLKAACQRQGFPLDTTLDWCTTELMYNGFKHGNRKATAYVVKIDNNVYIAVQDQGKGFDLEKGINSKLGIGLSTVKNLVDDIYNENNVVYIRKSVN